MIPPKRHFISRISKYHGLAMYLWRKVLLFSFNLLRQRHDFSVLLFIVHGHALWRGRMSKFGPIRNHYHVHLVDHSARVGCSTFCCAAPCWREPTSSKQLSTVAAFCWFSVWSLSCRCRVKFSTQSNLAEIWVILSVIAHWSRLRCLAWCFKLARTLMMRAFVICAHWLQGLYSITVPAHGYWSEQDFVSSHAFSSWLLYDTQ